MSARCALVRAVKGHAEIGDSIIVVGQSQGTGAAFATELASGIWTGR
jgi:hypothetical protein